MIRLALVAALLTALVSPASAQEPSLAARAREAFEDHDYARALHFLEQLHADSPSPRILFNEAVCLSRLARHREAVVVLEELLAWPGLGEIFGAPEIAAAEEALEASRARLVSLRLVGPPATAARIDGELECTLPCVLSLDEGAHSVEYGGHVEHVTLTRGRDSALELGGANPEPAPPPSSRRFQPGMLTWVGAGLAVAGTAGVIGFGLRSNELKGQYDAAGPSAPESLADEGRLMTGLANASLIVLGVGLVMVLIDLLIEKDVD